MRRWLRYAGIALPVTIAAVAGGWFLLAEAGRRGVLVAGAVALPLQLALFAGLVTRATASPGFLAVWVGGTLLRLLAVGGTALWVVGREGVDTGSTLLALVGLLFVLLLLEPWALRDEK